MVLVTSFDRGTVIGEVSDQAVARLALCLHYVRVLAALTVFPPTTSCVIRITVANVNHC